MFLSDTKKANIIAKILLLQVCFLFLEFCIRRLGIILSIHSDVKWLLGIILLLGFSFGLCKYILKSEKMFRFSLLIGLSFFVLFEIFKYIEFISGILPRYGRDVPIIISASLSLVAILIYVTILYVVCLMWKWMGCSKS